MTTLLALDASTTAVGWSVFIDGEYEASGVFKPQGKDWRERVRQICDWLDWALWVDDIPEANLVNGEIDAIAYEIATGRHGNVATDRKLGAVEWACWSVAEDWGLRWIAVTASEVKASGCHKRRLPVARAISGKEDIGGDEADAIGVALAALGKVKRDA